MAEQGERGPKGDPGDRAERGARGPRGDPGNDGGYPEGTPQWLRLTLTIIQKVGIATFIVIVGGYWLATRVAEPLMASYNESIRVQNKVIQDQAVSIDKIGRVLEERQEFSRKAEKMMTAFSEANLRNQNQLLTDHQRIMTGLDKKP